MNATQILILLFAGYGALVLGVFYLKMDDRE